MDKHKIANVSVIESAVPIMEPVKPKKRLNVLIGGFLGLFAGIGIAFLIEFINPVFHTREDVHHFLGLPVLATLPTEQLDELEGKSKKTGRTVLLLVTSLLLITVIGFTLWYFKVHRAGDPPADEDLQIQERVQNSVRSQKSNHRLGTTADIDYLNSTRRLRSNPEQVVRNEKAVMRNIESGVAIRPNGESSETERNLESDYAQIETPQLTYFKEQKGFSLNFKLVNPERQ